MGTLNVHLVIIDPQNDFVLPTGALSVPGAQTDMDRLARMIDRIGSKVEDIHVTLDSHHEMDVAHPAFWKDSQGNHPTPFTIIGENDDNWRTSVPQLNERMRKYRKELAKGGKYPLMIWSPHCRIGSSGACVYEPLRNALANWEKTQFATIDWVTKGSNPYVEHYSAVQAEVVDPEDPSTQLNVRFIQSLESADIIAFAGEAGSHCVKFSFTDLVNNFPPDVVKKCVLLTDAMSPVISPAVDFPKIQREFIADMQSKGVQTSTTVDFLR